MSLIPRLPYKWRIYWHGLIASILNGIGSSGAVVVVDPEDFNPAFGGSWFKLTTVIGVAALMSFFTYLKAHPLPDPDKDTDATAAGQKKIDEIRSSGTNWERDGNGGMR